MKSIPQNLQEKLKLREASNSLRELPSNKKLIDFSSNDYIGFAKNPEISKLASSLIKDTVPNGATGSRLLSGNHNLYHTTEQLIANFHQQESALIFNSGYNANIGFFSAVPQRGDVVFYDELIHASIRDGLTMGVASNFNFKHNNFEDLAQKVERWKNKNKGIVYVVTESVFSMDGDNPDLIKLSNFCETNSLYLVVDEAHALGVLGKNGCGLVQDLKLQEKVFAQIVTYGKGLGCHGAAIIGSKTLKSYLVNFARSLIYTTALPPHTIASIQTGYRLLNQETNATNSLRKNIAFFNQKVHELGLEAFFIDSDSAIHCCMISGISNVKKMALQIQQQGFDIKPILSPTVPERKERLRICLHSYNTFLEIESILKLVSKFLKT